VDFAGAKMNTSIAIAEAAPVPAARQPIALVGILLVRSFGLAAGVALVLLAAAILFVR
jgi:hypothetical protein